MERVVPWAALCRLIDPSDPKPAGRGGLAHPFLAAVVQRVGAGSGEGTYDPLATRDFVDIAFAASRCPAKPCFRLGRGISPRAMGIPAHNETASQQRTADDWRRVRAAARIGWPTSPNFRH
jgi:hypothetical protein